MTLLLIYLFIALFISFMCSVLEAVLLSTPISYLNIKDESGEKSARTFLKLKANIDRPLSAILTLNTVAHTIGAAGVGAQAVKVFGEAYFGIISAILTVLILIVSEIIPKTIGASYWRNLALPSGQLMHYLVIITYPSVVISELITRFFSKKEANSVSREEISAMANIGAKEGIFDENENKIIQNLIKLKTLRVNEVMTPRVVMVSANEDMTLEEFLENKDFLYFSRIPIYKKNQENITGYIFRENVFEKLAESHENLTLKDLKREIVTVHDNKLLFDLWNFLLGKKEHIALVLDEYGGVDGIITMEDIIETLLGLEIIDEKDSISDMREYAKERWEKRKTKYNKLNPNKENG